MRQAGHVLVKLGDDRWCGRALLANLDREGTNMVLAHRDAYISGGATERRRSLVRTLGCDRACEA